LWYRHCRLLLETLCIEIRETFKIYLK
jgi:hypothetical protein